MKAQFESSINEASREEFIDMIRPPDWLTSDQPRKSPYFPQMGDEVIYFFQGHQKYMEEVKKHELYKLEKTPLPWDKVPHLRVCSELPRL